jgi:hypothetical protein
MIYNDAGNWWVCKAVISPAGYVGIPVHAPFRFQTIFYDAVELQSWHPIQQAIDLLFISTGVTFFLIDYLTNNSTTIFLCVNCLYWSYFLQKG